MIRRIITIDEEKCNGCGLCADVTQCHPCFDGADLLIGCPELDRVGYSEKLTEIFEYNNI